MFHFQAPRPDLNEEIVQHTVFIKLSDTKLNICYVISSRARLETVLIKPTVA